MSAGGVDAQTSTKWNTEAAKYSDTLKLELPYGTVFPFTVRAVLVSLFLTSPGTFPSTGTAATGLLLWPPWLGASASAQLTTVGCGLGGLHCIALHS